jgi:alpha-L-rhamnosidase
MYASFLFLRANGLPEPISVSSHLTRLTWQASDDSPHPCDQVLVSLSPHRHSVTEADSPENVTIDLSPSSRTVTIVTPSWRIVYWAVGERRGDQTTWSEVSRFTVAPDLEASGAEWVTHPDLALPAADHRGGSLWFSMPFRSRSSDTTTLVHLAASGVVELRVDGREHTDRVLGPGYSDLVSEVAASTYDLGFLAEGPHTLTIELASGPYWLPAQTDRYTKFSAESRQLALIAMLEQLGESSRTSVTSAGVTQCGRGATVLTHWYGGEDFDARLPEPWAHGDSLRAVRAPRSPPEIWWPEYPPLRVVEVLHEMSAVTVPGGRLIDFGTNIAGWPLVRWSSSPHEREVRLLPAEQATPFGVDQDSTGSPIYDSLVISPATSGEWHPRFTYHGFRYVELQGADDVGVKAMVVRASNATVGEFTSSDAFLSKLHDASVRAVQGNMFSVFTDCPHREKLGWIEQLYLCFDLLVRNFDCEAHLRDSLHHIRRAQLPSGAIPNIAPEFVDFTGHAYEGDPDAFRFDVNWGSAILHLPLKHYRQYGDRRVLKDNLPAMKAYLRHLSDIESHGLIDIGLGDWIALDRSTPRVLVASFGYVRALEAAQEVAEIIGDTKWAAAALERRIAVMDSIDQLEVSPTASQSELTIRMSFAERRADEASAKEFLRRLVARIEQDGLRFTVGEVTFEEMVDALTRQGMGDFVYKIIRRPDVPGYGMQVARGVTALAETWSAERLEVGEGSHNHFMLGMIDHWLQGRVAGLRQRSDSIGWATAIVEPVFLHEVGSASTRHSSPRGTYGTSWHRSDDGRVVIVVDVPLEGAAEIRIPGEPPVMVGAGNHIFHTKA